MRMPTPKEQLYAWWRETLENPDARRPLPQDPQVGFFKRKLVKGGVFVPARIWMVQEIDRETGELLSDELLQCEVNGAYADPEEAWSWICANPISEAEFRYLTARISYAQRNEPNDAFADPRKAIDMNKLPVPF